MATEYLGICERTGMIYEGDFGSAHRVQPTPVLLPIQFVDDYSIEPLQRLGGQPKQLFREDFYDPISRIRRGRVFLWHSQEHTWHVQDPFRNDLKSEPWGYGHAQVTKAYVYQKDPLNELHKNPHLRVRLGDEEHGSFWKILQRESLASGSYLLTLKSYRSLGEIPEIDYKNVPESVQSTLAEDLERVERSANRMSPDDVVDRCRNTLTIIYGELAGDRSKDLDQAIRHFRKAFPDKEFMTNAGHMVQRLHSRGKACEQHSRQLRPLSEEDAQLALRCLGFLLVESGWAKPSMPQA